MLSYCSDGDLFSQITEKSTYLGNDALIKDVFLQIVEAVEYCHRLGIYHRDLKPENILCDQGGRRVVLADFGLATAEKTSGDFGCGSTFYMSPGMLFSILTGSCNLLIYHFILTECQGGLFQRLGSYSTLHNDVWSLGVILVNLTCGRNPWKQACPNDETFRAYLSNPDFLRSILPVSKQCNELLKRIFALNPASRISMKDLKAEVKRMSRWTMTFEELRYATRATKEAARSWAPAWVLDDPSVPDAPPPKPPQPLPAQPKEVPQQPKVRPPRETIFDITDTSTISSVDSLQEWQAHQQQQQQFQQQIKRSHARIQGPHIPSPVSSPSVSSVCPEFPAPPQPTRARQPVAGVSNIRTGQEAIANKVALNLRSNFSLSDSDDATSDEDEEMDYGTRPTTYITPTKPFQAQLPQHTPLQQQRISPSPHSLPKPSSPHARDFAFRPPKDSPPPLTSQAPRTPRQCFTAASNSRARKQSFESNSSSSSSASSDASWTGLPPTPDTPVFARRPPASGLTAVEKPQSTSTFSIGAGKLKFSF